MSQDGVEDDIAHDRAGMARQYLLEGGDVLLRLLVGLPVLVERYQRQRLEREHRDDCHFAGRWTERDVQPRAEVLVCQLLVAQSYRDLGPRLVVKRGLVGLQE